MDLAAYLREELVQKPHARRREHVLHAHLVSTMPRRPDAAIARGYARRAPRHVDRAG